jgi:hypothetical protein
MKVNKKKKGQMKGLPIECIVEVPVIYPGFRLLYYETITKKEFRKRYK